MSGPLITLRGKASEKETKFILDEEAMEQTLLDFLFAKGIPIASSCQGRGSCKKCVFNDDRLSCQVKIKDLVGEKVYFSYL